MRIAAGSDQRAQPVAFNGWRYATHLGVAWSMEIDSSVGWRFFEGRYVLEVFQPFPTPLVVDEFLGVIQD